jgi:hypothetical protein
MEYSGGGKLAPSGGERVMARLQRVEHRRERRYLLYLLRADIST